ncbi:hypothetical protein SLE2022_277690 [Rubroshorea leprosula]
MASHHHHHHHQTTTCCSSGHCCNPPPPPPPPPVQTTDSLLQALASLLLQQQQSSDQIHLERSHQNQSCYKHRPHFHRREENHQDVQFVLPSLLSRIEALESSLQHFSTYSAYPCRCLRDTAARVIQTHFRAFLVRRSKTLRQLKELALIKSSFSSLKLSISNKTHFDLDAVSRKAMDLLVTLDCIQGADPLIRDGKRSIGRDLLLFLDYIDGIAAKEHKVYYRTAKNVRVVVNGNKSRVSGSRFGEVGQDRREVVERLRNRVEKIRGSPRVVRNEDEDGVELEGFCQVIDEVENPRISINAKTGVCASPIRNRVLVKRQVSQPKVKKTVSFAENGNVYKVFSNVSRNENSSIGEGTLTDESVSSDDRGEILENPCKETANDQEAQMENGESVQSSDEERSSRGNLRKQYNSQIGEEDEDGAYNLMFSAPLPARMESRVDLNKNKGVKIA